MTVPCTPTAAEQPGWAESNMDAMSSSLGSMRSSGGAELMTAAGVLLGTGAGEAQAVSSRAQATSAARVVITT